MMSCWRKVEEGLYTFSDTAHTKLLLRDIFPKSSRSPCYGRGVSMMEISPPKLDDTFALYFIEDIGLGWW